jgi:hypothetical protein
VGAFKIFLTPAKAQKSIIKALYLFSGNSSFILSLNSFMRAG